MNPEIKAARIAVAIPASLISDTPHLREKTGKLGLVARACSTFGVSEIILYADDSRRDQKADLELCGRILTFIETPQYLRKRIFRLSPDLKFTGILPPLQTPPHNVPRRLQGCKVGDLREGFVIERVGANLLVDVGLEKPLEFSGNLQPQTRVTVRITNLEKNLVGEIVEGAKISIYWGYRVRQPKFRLSDLLEKEKFDLRIGTSRYGTMILDVWRQISDSMKNAGSVLIAFGSPRLGLLEVLGQEGKDPRNVFDYFINALPGQNVATVRTEEALLITLGLVNVMRFR